MDLSNQPPAKVPKPSLPIARNNGPGYERPERARTSHACEPCRERKTKCDGERPSCRRCLHTGTPCHYGYGKGWRKRKTAEDLNVTSKKLQRYESLLQDIIPMVNPEVRAMIEDVRQQEAAAADTPESADSSSSMSNQPHMVADHERSTSSSNARLPLPLPMPNTMSQQSRTPSIPFDRMSESTSPHLAHHPKREVPFDDPAGNRLPSITPHGLLIENGIRDSSPNFTRASASSGPHRGDQFSPTSTGGFHESSSGWSTGSTKQYRDTDNWSSAHPSSTSGLTSPVRTGSQYQYQYQYSRTYDSSTAVA